MNHSPRSIITLLLTAATLLLAGCSTPIDRHYYVLDTGSETKAKPAANHHVVVLQVEIPPYLDQSRLVSRDNNNQLHIADAHQWGGLLRANIARILAGNLASRATVATAPLPGGLIADASLLITIRQFERQADGHVMLTVQWHLITKGKPTRSRTQTLTDNSSIGERDYSGMTTAMSRLLARLSDDIATTLE